MKKFLKITAVILAIIVVFSPVIILGSMIFGLPSQHRQSYVGYLNNKVSRLYSIEEEKVVVIGGSSVAFALDSELMERELGMPVVNFGLYAALGTKLMLDLSRDAIGEGDVVILSPELDAQTLSMFFNTENTLNAVDDDLSLLSDIPSEHWLSLIGGSWRFASEKLNYYIDGEKVPTDIYRAENFNKYGDIKAGLRKENIMSDYYKSNQIISLTPEIVDSEFIDYLNEYINYCYDVGASVYFNWCPINKAGLSEHTTEDSLLYFSDYMRDALDCQFIGDRSVGGVTDNTLICSADYGPIIDKAYFYDTNFHLNDAGVTYYTVNLINNYYETIGSDDFCEVRIPDKPALPTFNTFFAGYDENSKYFTYEVDNTGAVITGLTDEGKKQKELTLPVGVGDTVVSKIGEGAFKGGVATTLIIPEDSKCQSIGNGAFDGSGVVKLYLYQNYVVTLVDENGEEREQRILINPPAAFPPGLKIYTPEPEVYKAGYEWANVPGLSSMLVGIVD